MRLSILFVLFAAPAGAAVAVKEVPAALPPAAAHATAAVALAPLTPLAASLQAPALARAPFTAAPALSALPAAMAAASAPMSRDIARDAAAAKLAEAGFDQELAKHGLLLWHVLSARTRSGDRAFLTVSLPWDGRHYERGADDPERQKELGRRLAAAEKRVTALAAQILGMDEDMIGVSGRLIESCCGAGCQSCLLTKKEHAEKWTGEPARRTRD